MILFILPDPGALPPFRLSASTWANHENSACADTSHILLPQERTSAGGQVRQCLAFTWRSEVHCGMSLLPNIGRDYGNAALLISSWFSSHSNSLVIFQQLRCQRSCSMYFKRTAYLHPHPIYSDYYLGDPFSHAQSLPAVSFIVPCLPLVFHFYHHSSYYVYLGQPLTGSLHF